jgi:transcription elongation factor Elf1
MLGTQQVQCPYCGENIEVILDLSVEHQAYIEDCQVCCRPIEFDVTAYPGSDAIVVASHENE